MHALLCLNNWSKQGFVKEAAALPKEDDEAEEESDIEMVL
jgi:hypothetical protein